MTYTHYILTRFNVGLYCKTYWPKDREGRDIIPESWMQERFHLFETFCLPSIMSQSNKNFRWIVYYDSKTPSKWNKKIESYKKVCPNYNYKFVSTTCRSELYNPILKESKLRYHSHIVTTRFDNDDCISINFVETVQNNIKSNKKFINLSKGYLYDYSKKLFYNSNLHANSFMSAVEEIGTAKTILGWGNHAKLKGSPEILDVEDRPYWIRVIHEHNLMNHIHGKDPKSEKPDGFFF